MIIVHAVGLFFPQTRDVYCLGMRAVGLVEQIVSLHWAPPAAAGQVGSRCLEAEAACSSNKTLDCVSTP
jgi:hypothetical protein